MILFGTLFFLNRVCGYVTRLILEQENSLMAWLFGFALETPNAVKKIVVKRYYTLMTLIILSNFFLELSQFSYFCL